MTMRSGWSSLQDLVTGHEVDGACRIQRSMHTSGDRELWEIQDKIKGTKQSQSGNGSFRKLGGGYFGSL